MFLGLSSFMMVMSSLLAIGKFYKYSWLDLWTTTSDMAKDRHNTSCDVAQSQEVGKLYNYIEYTIKYKFWE